MGKKQSFWERPPQIRLRRARRALRLFVFLERRLPSFNKEGRMGTTMSKDPFSADAPRLPSWMIPTFRPSAQTSSPQARGLRHITSRTDVVLYTPPLCLQLADPPGHLLASSPGLHPLSRTAPSWSPRFLVCLPGHRPHRSLRQLDRKGNLIPSGRHTSLGARPARSSPSGFYWHLLQVHLLPCPSPSPSPPPLDSSG